MKEEPGLSDWRIVAPREVTTPPTDRTKCVLYTRVSSMKQETQGDGLRSQRKRILEFIEARGLEPIHRIEVVAEGGDDEERRSLEELVSICTRFKDEVKYVVVSDFIRCSRGSPAWIDASARLARLGIFTMDVSGISTETPEGQYHAEMQIASGKLALKQMSKKALAAAEEKRERGCPCQKAPTGLLNTRLGKDPTFIPDPGKADKVIHLLHMAIDRIPDCELLAYCSRVGLTRRNGRPMSRQALFHLLRNPVYAGYIKPGRRGGALIRGNFPPLIKEEEFDALQRVLQERSRSRKYRKSAKVDRPLTVMLRCPVCGSPCSGYSSKGIDYYRCRASSKHFHTRADRVNLAFEESLARVRLNPIEREFMLASLLKEYSTMRRMYLASDRIEAVHKRIRELEVKRVQLDEAFMAGAFDAINAGRLYREIDKSMEELVEVLDGVLAVLPDGYSLPDTALDLLDEPRRIWEEPGLHDRKELVRMLFPDGVTYYGEEGFSCIAAELDPLFSLEEAVSPA